MTTAVEKYVDPPTERAIATLRIEAQQIGRAMTLPDSLRGPEHLPDLMKVGLVGASLGVRHLAHSVDNIHIIEGRTSISADLSMGVAEVRAGVIWHKVFHDETRCVVSGRRRDWPQSWPDTVVEWTIDDARRGGLLDVTWKLWKKNENGRSYLKDTWMEMGWDIVAQEWVDNRGKAPDWVKDRDAKRSYKENWLRWPKAMLMARAKKELAKSLASAALTGVGGHPIDLDLSFEDEHLDVDAPATVNGRIVSDPGDDDITDAEIVDPEPELTADEWAHRWGGLCRAAGATPANSKAILRNVAGVEFAAQVLPDRRTACETALADWVAAMSEPAEDA